MICLPSDRCESSGIRAGVATVDGRRLCSSQRGRGQYRAARAGHESGSRVVHPVRVCTSWTGRLGQPEIAGAVQRILSFKGYIYIYFKGCVYPC